MTNAQRMLAVLVPALAACVAQAGTVQVGVDVSKSWLSFAQVHELPTEPGAERGAFVYGQFYEPGFYATPPGTITGNLAQLRPNTTLGAADTDTANPFHRAWWKSDGAGGLTANKIIQDGFYMEDDSLAGNQITFSGLTVANTLAAPYGASARAFIIDTVGPAYAFFAVQYTPLVVGQAFSVSLAVEAGHHVAYGIEITGPNARASQLVSLGVLQVSAIPEPAAALLLSAGLAGLLLRQRRS